MHANGAEPAGNGHRRSTGARAEHPGHRSPPRRRVRVLLAEDNPSIRETLVKLLRDEPAIDLVGVAHDAPAAVDLARRVQPDVAVLDVKMPGGGGYRAAREILASRSTTTVMALSAYEDRATVLEMVRAGAIGYALKGDPVGDIVEAIHRTAAGTGTLAPRITGGVLGTLAKQLERNARARGYRDDVERRVRHVIETGGPAIVFQPIVDLTSGHVAGFEALSRFPGPRGAGVWFSDADSVDLRQELEIAAVRRAAASHPRLPDPAYLSINVSPDVVADDRFREALGEIPAKRVVVEITEHACVADYAETARAIEPLREHGVRLAVDDAGGGFASMKHVLRLSPDIVKLDVDITRDVDSDPARKALASGLLSFARDTRAELVAEGIETANELETLQELGVPYGQGYRLARPAAASAPECAVRTVAV